MEELKILVNMVATLPQMALWVIAFFFAYKVMIVGSIYGVIRFCVERLYKWAITPKEKLVTVTKDFDGILYAHTNHQLLKRQLLRIADGGSNISTSNIAHLEVALDEYINARKQIWWSLDPDRSPQNPEKTAI